MNGLELTVSDFLSPRRTLAWPSPLFARAAKFPSRPRPVPSGPAMCPGPPPPGGRGQGPGGLGRARRPGDPGSGGRLRGLRMPLRMDARSRERLPPLLPIRFPFHTPSATLPLPFPISPPYPLLLSSPPLFFAAPLSEDASSTHIDVGPGTFSEISQQAREAALYEHM